MNIYVCVIIVYAVHKEERQMNLRDLLPSLSSQNSSKRSN